MTVMDETLRVFTRRYKAPLSEALELTDWLIPLIEVIPISHMDCDVVKKAMSCRLKTSDALHIASMSKAGIKNIASEDSEFDKISLMKGYGWIT